MSMPLLLPCIVSPVDGCELASLCGMGLLFPRRTAHAFGAHKCSGSVAPMYNMYGFKNALPSVPTFRSYIVHSSTGRILRYLHNIIPSQLLCIFRSEKSVNRECIADLAFRIVECFRKKTSLMRHISTMVLSFNQLELLISDSHATL